MREIRSAALSLACCLLMGNNELVMDLLEVGEYEKAKHTVAWLISAAKQPWSRGGISPKLFRRGSRKFSPWWTANSSTLTDRDYYRVELF